MAQEEKRSNLLLYLLFALLGLSIFNPNSPAPSGSPAQSGTEETVTFTTAPAGPQEDRLQEQCKPIPEPLKPVCHAYAQWTDKQSKGDYQTLPWAKRFTERNPIFAMATVPDPDITNLDLYFDRSIRSIMAAAGRHGYTMDRIWLPWRPGASGTARSDKDQSGKTTTAQQDEISEPGVLLFRNSAGQPLVVFLVGESPISGLRRRSFRNALLYQHTLGLSASRSSSEVLILGPNFSGTFTSLQQEIEAASQSMEFGSNYAYHVISPNATVKSAQEKFLATKANLTYSAILHDDTEALERFRSYLAKQWPFKYPQAFLAEGETAFGEGLKTAAKPEQLPPGQKSDTTTAKEPDSAATQDSVALTFPREISLLRLAYPDAARQTLYNPSRGKNTQSNDPISKGEGRSGVPVFAEQQTVASMEAQLLQIAQVLQRSNIPIAGIGATDVLDLVFVSGYLRQSVPNTRVFVMDSDLLMVRATANYSVDGSLLITDFPLFAESARWLHPKLTPNAGASRWESASLIGFYNLLFKVHPMEAPEHPEPKASWPLWLSVLSRDSIWPIALLDNPLENASAQGLNPSHSLDVSPPLSWKIILIILSVMTLVFAVVVLVAQTQWGNQQTSMLADYRLTPGEPGTAGRSYYLLTGGLLLLALLATHLLPLYTLHELSANPASIIWAAISTILLLAALGVSVAAAIRHFLTPLRKGGNESKELRISFAALSVLGTLVLFGYFGALAHMFLGHPNENNTFHNQFRAFRSLYPLSGVSPILPLQVIGLSMLLMFVVHLRRHNAFVGSHPYLPDTSGDIFLSGAGRVYRAIWDALAWPFLGVSRAPLLLPAALAVCLLPFILKMPQSLETGWYDVLYVISLAVAVLLALQVWLRFLLIWASLRSLLNALETHPIRTTFSDLPPEFSQIPLLGGGNLYSTEIVLSRSVDILRKLEQERPGTAFPDDPGGLAHLECSVDWFLNNTPSALPECRASFADLNDRMAGIATRLFKWLQECWSTGCSAREKADLPASKITGAALAEEFIALRYTAFIRYVLIQLRNLLFFLIVGFFLVVVSGLVYPFRSQDLFGWASTLSFLLLGIPVAVAIFQMDRNNLLRRLRSREGTADSSHAMLRVLAYGLLPLLALALAHFPGLSRYLGTWLAPALQALGK